jgi:hypothetical protein
MNNQPAHHILYLFAVLGDAQSTQRLTREVVNRGFGIDFYSGDEDNGEQGAWFALTALGLYSISPGSVDYVFTSPLFRHVRIFRKKTLQYETYYEKPFHENEQEEAEGNEYFDLFAFGTENNNHRNTITDDLYVKKLILNNHETVGDAENGHSLVSDRIFQQSRGFMRFVYQKETAEDTARFNSLSQSLHQMKTREFEQHFGGPSTTLGETTKTIGHSEPDITSMDSINISKLQQKIRGQNEEILKLQKQLQGKQNQTDYQAFF